MRYRHVLLLLDLERDAHPALTFLRHALHQAETLTILATTPSSRFAWLLGESAPDQQQALRAAISSLHTAARDVAPDVTIQLASHVSDGLLEDLTASRDIDLFVTGPHPEAAGLAGELRKRREVTTLWIPDAMESSPSRPVESVVCVALGSSGPASVAAFLRDHGDVSQHATVLLSRGSIRPDGEETRKLAAAWSQVTFVTPGEQPAWRWLREHAFAARIDLLVFARFPLDLLLSTNLALPSLLLPPAPVARAARSDRIDGPDLICDGGPLRAQFEYTHGLGRRSPISDQEIAFVSHGRVVAAVRTHEGRAELPVGCQESSYGVLRTQGAANVDPMLAVELRIAALRPGKRPLVLFDADLPDEELKTLSPLRAQVDLLAVRIRPLRSPGSIRQRMRAFDLPALVVDASLVLNEGAAFDVTESLDNVRLSRVAARMHAEGFPVAAIVHRAGRRPSTTVFGAFRAHALADHADAGAWTERAPAVRPQRFEAITGAPQLAGNHVEVELDNAKARQWLLSAIATSRRRVHLQVYMAADDRVGREVEAALREAAGRGVTVRVLVDSLHALHGSLGAQNPLLARLEKCPGVELRVSRPIRGVPSLADVKQRDHRKLVVVDNALALIGGRNLSHEYYTGFDEASLTAHSMWREVPWLDAGARLRGPGVTALERSFLEAWTRSGGAAFEVAESPAAGATPVRVVVHRGLRDAHTLEAYLELIEGARETLYVVNGFPLMLEIQHALLGALRRGVTVRALFGRLIPSHEGEPFEGPWSSARTAATALVHSRMDALIVAGAEAYQFTIPAQPHWSPSLGPVRSHVHAKLLSVDGRLCSVGSANLDVTAGYWESELLLVIEDPKVTAEVDAQLRTLLAGSRRIDPDNPSWKELARHREWMRHWPGVLAF